MENLKELILGQSLSLMPEIIRLRRHFHANPELSFKEYNTAGFIGGYLDKLGIPYRTGIAGTGIIATITGNRGRGRNVALRADMDALPIHEENESEYSSVNPGVMHACGHDAHMAILLGAAIILNGMRDSFGGKAILIFQPGEEMSPGGASLVIESGALNDPKPDCIIGLHTLPELEAGRLGFRAGRYMASADEISIEVRGRGGHVANPSQTTDQVYIAALLVTRLKDRIRTEQEKRGVPTILGIGRFNGSGAGNVIPDVVGIGATLRTFNEEWRREALGLIESIAGDIARDYGVEVRLDIKKGYPVLVNDEDMTERAILLSTELLGKDNVTAIDIRMGADDFAFYTGIYPALHYRVGVRRPGRSIRALHTSLFDIDEDALHTGVASLAWLALSFMYQ